MTDLTIRDRIAKAFLWAAVVAAPRQMRSVLGYVFKSIDGVPGQIEQGREGGVIIAPWFISDAGSELAHEQARRCWLTAGQTRTEFDRKEPRPEQEVCDLCDGKGVNMHGQLWPGRIACRACKGTGFEPATPAPAPAPSAQVERDRLAKMIEAMATQSPWADNVDCRMALAIAANNVRRGRPLTEQEKFSNLTKAIEEDDPDLAERLRTLASPAPAKAAPASETEGHDG
jgi:hypothetical protein